MIGERRVANAQPIQHFKEHEIHLSLEFSRMDLVGCLKRLQKNVSARVGIQTRWRFSESQVLCYLFEPQKRVHSFSACVLNMREQLPGKRGPGRD